MSRLIRKKWTYSSFRWLEFIKVSSKYNKVICRQLLIIHASPIVKPLMRVYSEAKNIFQAAYQVDPWGQPGICLHAGRSPQQIWSPNSNTSHWQDARQCVFFRVSHVGYFHKWVNNLNIRHLLSIISGAMCCTLCKAIKLRYQSL